MNAAIEKLLKQHAADLKRINDQRRIWLFASSIVVSCIIFLIFAWDWIDHFASYGVWWVVISLIMIISVNWWYWTMKVIRILLEHQEAEYTLLACILNDVSEAKKDIKFLVDQDVDLPK